MLPSMKWPLLAVAVLLAAAALDLVRALIVHHGVGIVEYVGGSLVVAALLLAALRLARVSLRRVAH